MYACVYVRMHAYMYVHSLSTPSYLHLDCDQVMRIIELCIVYNGNNQVVRATHLPANWPLLRYAIVLAET